MTDPVSRSWQLLMVGPGSRHITPDLHNRLMRLLDLLPQTRLIEIETDTGDVSVSRDWPSDRLEEVKAIEAEIIEMPGILRLTLFQAA
jgi:hypothetical protein